MKMKSDEVEKLIFEATETVLAEAGMGDKLKSAWSALTAPSGPSTSDPDAPSGAPEVSGAPKEIKTWEELQQGIYNEVYDAVKEDLRDVAVHFNMRLNKIERQLKAVGTIPGTGWEDDEGEDEEEERRPAGFVREQDEPLIDAVHEALAKLNKE